MYPYKLYVLPPLCFLLSCSEGSSMGVRRALLHCLVCTTGLRHCPLPASAMAVPYRRYFAVCGLPVIASMPLASSWSLCVEGLGCYCLVLSCSIPCSCCTMSADHRTWHAHVPCCLQVDATQNIVDILSKDTFTQEDVDAIQVCQQFTKHFCSHRGSYDSSAR